MPRFVVLGVILAAAHSLPAAAEAGGRSLQSRMDAIFRPWTGANAPGCAAGIMQAGKWLAKGGYGSASIEHTVRITPRTVFYIGSVSKQFTAAALLRLVDGGTVRLDDDVRKYVPELPEYDPPITLDHLVHHSSGLVDYLVPMGGTWQDRHSRREVLSMIAVEKPLFAAGQIYSYSNSNYFLIAEIIARASGKPFREFARQSLFAPLGMNDTRFYDDSSEIVPRYAAGYREEGRGRYRAVKTLYTQVGAGGLLTSIEDLGRWMRVYDDPDALPGSPRLDARLQERGRLSDGTLTEYAYGLVMGKERDLVSAWHNGFFYGYKASFTWLPEKRMGLFALCNWSEAPIDAIRNNLLLEALR